MNLFQVDAFADGLFRGNPAAVCLLEAFPDDDWLQNFAAEMNLSETAFLHRVSDGYALRWCTPEFEVDLCGHATLASAHVLWTEGHTQSDVIRFETRSGPLFAHRENDDSAQPLIRLDFPATPASAASPPDGLLEALGTTAEHVGRSCFDYLVHVASEQVLRELRPDFSELAKVDARGIIVTARGNDDPNHFISRFFCPAAGINEDPVTGSAHCTLAPYWAVKLGRTELTGFQASRRGGTVETRIVDDRVHLLGKAVTVFRGELAVTPQ